LGKGPGTELNNDKAFTADLAKNVYERKVRKLRARGAYAILEGWNESTTIQ
jgi:hypothetical protein